MLPGDQVKVMVTGDSGVLARALRETMQNKPMPIGLIVLRAVIEWAEVNNVNLADLRGVETKFKNN